MLIKFCLREFTNLYNLISIYIFNYLLLIENLFIEGIYIVFKPETLLILLHANFLSLLHKSKIYRNGEQVKWLRD